MNALTWLSGWILAAAMFAAPARAGCDEGCRAQEAPAVSTLWGGDAEAPTRLILATPSHSYGGPIWAAVEIDIADGWFVYASRASNAAGPELEWTGSTNLAPVVLRWPPPETVLIEGNPVAIYRGHIVLPISVAPIEADRDIELGLSFSYAVCGEVCRPGLALHRIHVSAAPVAVPDAAERNARMIADALILAGEH